jgi:hypothetical protein
MANTTAELEALLTQRSLTDAQLLAAVELRRTFESCPTQRFSKSADRASSTAAAQRFTRSWTRSSPPARTTSC